MNLILSVGTLHGVYLSFAFGRRMVCFGRYGDLCLWGADNAVARFRMGPRWPITWGLLTWNKPGAP